MDVGRWSGGKSRGACDTGHRWNRRHLTPGCGRLSGSLAPQEPTSKIPGLFRFYGCAKGAHIQFQCRFCQKRIVSRWLLSRPLLCISKMWPLKLWSQGHPTKDVSGLCLQDTSRSTTPTPPPACFLLVLKISRTHQKHEFEQGLILTEIEIPGL